MEGNYSLFIKNEQFDMTKEIQRQFDENEIDYPKKLNVTVSSSDPQKNLRTSKRITSYLLRGLTGEDAANLNSFSELSKRINDVILGKIRQTGCISQATVEGEFSNQINKYQYEQLDLKFRLNEEPIFSSEYGLSIDQKQRNFGLMVKPQLTNLFGQCEQIVLRLRKSFFDFNKETKAFTSFTFPFFSPDTFLQEYEFGMSNRQMLHDLRVNKFKLRGSYYSIKDPRWKFILSTTSHHFNPQINANNVIAEQGSIFDQTISTYQNLVLKASFTDKTLTQQDFSTGNVTQIQGQVGIGSNKSVFAKAKYQNIYQDTYPLSIGSLQISGLVENRFNVGCIFAKDDLSFTEKFTLVNQPSYKNIDLNEKSINSQSAGSRFFLTNQFKYYLIKYPFLQKINIHPFLHAYAAFVPTDMKVTHENKIPQYLNQNFRLSAGIGFTYEINNYDKVDFIYSFSDFFSKGNKDEFSKFQFNFYS